jgi:hypothetical protein
VKVRYGQIRVGRVLHEDDDLITIEVAKNEHRQLNIEEGDQFLSLLFVHQPPGMPVGQLRAWLPWLRDPQ